jgi:hypothetical protein
MTAQQKEALLKIAEELDKKDKLLYRISAMCGNPDSGDACRKIIKLIQEESECESN